MSWQIRLGAALIAAGEKLQPASTGRARVPPPIEVSVVDQLAELTEAALSAPEPEDLIDTIQFAAGFRRHAPFNARLIQLQRRGASIVASRKEWATVDRRIAPDARPILILMPFAPVVQVFEVGDTLPLQDRPASDPFAVSGPVTAKAVGEALDRLEAGCRESKLFAIWFEREYTGTNLAGTAAGQGMLVLPEPVVANGHEHSHVEADVQPAIARPGRRRMIPAWRVKVNHRMTDAEQLVTIAHELGHIFCGHLGGCEGQGDSGGWPVRTGLSHSCMEMEAEAVAWLIARRAGLNTGSAAYLKRHVSAMAPGEHVDVDLVTRAAGRIEAMAKLRYTRSM